MSEGAAGKDALMQAAVKAAEIVDLPKGKTITDVMSDPGALANMSEKLASAINSAINSSVPPACTRKVNSLKNLQKTITQLEVDFYKEVQLLEAKYHKLYQPYYRKRATIVSGAYQPTDEECHWAEANSKDDDESGGETEGKEKAEDKKEDTHNGEDVKGIPEFWCTAFKNCDILMEFMKECDEEVLKHLVDVRVTYAKEDGLDFSISYEFSENEWFTNRVLTMTYEVKCEVDESDPWVFEGATIRSCKGCPIHWNKNKDLTVRVVKKKSRSKGKGQSKGAGTKQVHNETFFNMFSFNHYEKVPGITDEEKLTTAMMANYNLAEFIRDRLVPRATLFYTGDAVEDDDDDDEDDCSFDENEEEGLDEEDEYDAEGDVNAVKPECKQQ